MGSLSPSGSGSAFPNAGPVLRECFYEIFSTIPIVVLPPTFFGGLSSSGAATKFSWLRSPFELLLLARIVPVEFLGARIGPYAIRLIMRIL